MKKIIICFGLLLCLISMSQSADPSKFYNITQLANITLDHGLDSVQVTITSGCVTVVFTGTLSSSDTLTHTRLQSIIDILAGGTTVYQGEVFTIKQELTSSSTEYAITVSSIATTTIAGVNWKQLKIQNNGGDYLWYKTGANNNVNVDGQFIDAGLTYIEDESYQGDFYLQANAGSDPLDVRISRYDK